MQDDQETSELPKVRSVVIERRSPTFVWGTICLLLYLLALLVCDVFAEAEDLLRWSLRSVLRRRR